MRLSLLLIALVAALTADYATASPHINRDGSIEVIDDGKPNHIGMDVGGDVVRHMTQLRNWRIAKGFPTEGLEAKIKGVTDGSISLKKVPFEQQPKLGGAVAAARSAARGPASRDAAAPAAAAPTGQVMTVQNATHPLPSYYEAPDLTRLPYCEPPTWPLYIASPYIVAGMWCADMCPVPDLEVEFPPISTCVQPTDPLCAPAICTFVYEDYWFCGILCETQSDCGTTAGTCKEIWNLGLGVCTHGDT